MQEKIKTKEQFMGKLNSMRMNTDDAEKIEFRYDEIHDALKELMFATLDAIPHAVLGLKDRHIIFANNAVEIVFGWHPEELMGRSTRILYQTDEDYEKIAERFYPILEQQRTFMDEFPCRRKDGKDIICVVSASRIGDLLQDRMIIVTYEDVTNRKRSDAELNEYRGYLEKLVDIRTNDLRGANELLRREIAERKQAVELYKTLADKSIAGVFVVKDGKFSFINSAAIAYTGYTPEEMIGRDSDFLIHPEDRESVKKMNRKMLKEINKTPHEFRIITKQETIRWVMQTVMSIQHEGHRAVLGSTMDITDRKRADEERYRREKLQGILEMAGTICHEMNQPMQIISGYSELLLMNTPDNDPIYNKLKTIGEQIRRMGSITRKLMMIKEYKTQDYVGFGKIIDLQNAAFDFEQSKEQG